MRLPALFRVRETVAIEKPVALAMSRMVTTLTVSTDKIDL
jgi:hypothetical protein